MIVVNSPWKKVSSRQRINSDKTIMVPKRLFNPRKWYHTPQKIETYGNEDVVMMMGALHDRQLIIYCPQYSNSTFSFTISSKQNLRNILGKARIISSDNKYRFDGKLYMTYHYNGKTFKRTDALFPFTYHRKRFSFNIELDRLKPIVDDFTLFGPSSLKSIGLYNNRACLYTIPYSSNEELVSVSLSKLTRLILPIGVTNFNNNLENLHRSNKKFVERLSVLSFLPFNTYCNLTLFLLLSIGLIVGYVFWADLKLSGVVALLLMVALFNLYDRVNASNPDFALENNYAKPSGRRILRSKLSLCDPLSIDYDNVRRAINLSSYETISLPRYATISSSLKPVMTIRFRDQGEFVRINFITAQVVSMIENGGSSGNRALRELVVNKIRRFRQANPQYKSFLFDCRSFSFKPLAGNPSKDEGYSQFLMRSFTDLLNDLAQDEINSLEKNNEK